MPCVEQIEPLLGLAAGARLARMHMDAIGAAIDLRGARLDQIDQRMVEPALPHVILERHQRLHPLARGFVGGSALESSSYAFRFSIPLRRYWRGRPCRTAVTHSGPCARLSHPQNVS